MKYELPSIELIVIEENNYLKFGEYLNDMQCDDTANKLSLDDLEYVKKLQQENKILKENAENNDKVVDKVNWENMLLKKENQELKKQLEEYENELEKADSITQSCIFNGKKESEISYRKCLNMLEKHKNQLKEFIDYLEKTIVESKAGSGQQYYYQQVLDMYKEIIGRDKK